MNDDNGDLYHKRDMIMQKLLDNSEFMKERFTDYKKEFEEHVVEDRTFQKHIESKLSLGIKIAIVVLIIVAANGGWPAIKMLFNIGG